MATRGSRWQKSVHTYGLVGRVLWTVGSLALLYFLLWPTVRIVRGGLINAGVGAIVPLFLAVAGVILLIWIWPRFIRDIWQPASVAGNELTDLRDRTRREAELRQHTAQHIGGRLLTQRTAPSRW